MAARNMGDFQEDSENCLILNKDNISRNDVIKIKDNNFGHNSDNKNCYTRRPVSDDLLLNAKGQGIRRCWRRSVHADLQDMRSADFWRACFTEFVGTFLLCFYHIGIILFGSSDGEPPPLLHISIGHGLFVTAVVTALGETSGCHMNPAVTIALASLNEVGIIRIRNDGLLVAFTLAAALCVRTAVILSEELQMVILYVVCQCAGAIAGSMLLSEISHPHLTGNLGVISPGPNITNSQVVSTEIIITAFLLVVVAATSDKRRHDVQGSAPLVVGLTIVVNTLIANKVSGSCMNPARALGPAVVKGEFTNFWIYWVGPCCGALIGAHLYRWILAPTVTLGSSPDCCITRKPDRKDVHRPEMEQFSPETLPETDL